MPTLELTLTRSKKKTHNRIVELDVLRGLAILLMILDHLRYDIAVLPRYLESFGGNYRDFIFDLAPLSNWCSSLYGEVWYQSLHVIFVAIFFLVSGICVNFSKNHWKRSLLISVLAYLLTTVLFAYSRFSGQYNMNIYMGVLNCFALAHMAYSLKYTFFKDYKSDFYFAGILLVLSLALNSAEPVILVDENPIYVLNHYGDLIAGRIMAGLDYIHPLGTMTFLFLGAGIGKLLYKNRKSYLPFLKYAEPLGFFGRHSLLIYIIHQPIMILIITIVLLSMGYLPSL